MDSWFRSLLPVPSNVESIEGERGLKRLVAFCFPNLILLICLLLFSHFQTKNTKKKDLVKTDINILLRLLSFAYIQKV
jgi:hypothetical protein